MFRWIMICCLGVVSVFTAVADDRIYGWPQLKAPEGLIVCTAVQDKAEMMLLESLSGLAARAVNEGRFDKMVWITTGNRSYERIFEASKAALHMEDISYMNVWQLLEYLQKEHVVKGYVVYGLEKEQGKIIKDYSSNVATVYAALTGGAMFDVSIEDEARRRELRKLKDARTETALECFHKNRHLLKNVSALTDPDGYCGDEDNGQTSAWYVFSALGFYPVCPATDQYVLGAPLFKKAVLHFENGRKLVIEAPRNSDKNIYVKSLRLNRKNCSRNYLRHDQIVRGGVLRFDMDSRPNYVRGVSPDAFPYSFSDEWGH